MINDTDVDFDAVEPEQLNLPVDDTDETEEPTTEEVVEDLIDEDDDEDDDDEDEDNDDGEGAIIDDPENTDDE